MADQEDPERMEDTAIHLEGYLLSSAIYNRWDIPLDRDDLRIIINSLRLSAREIRRKAKLMETKE